MENTRQKDNQLPITYLRPARGWLAVDFGELWRYRELIYFLTWRDIKVRYKQAVLGVAWAVLQPLLTVGIFTVIFGILLEVPSQGIPYPLFSLTALLPWQLFATSLQRSSVSLVGNANLLTKIYFPRLAIPLSSVMASLVDFGVSFMILLAVMVYYRFWPGVNILWIIPLSLFTLFTSLAIGLWLSALNVQYRDVQHMVPFIIQVWMYASPIVYPHRNHSCRDLAFVVWAQSDGGRYPGVSLGAFGGRRTGPDNADLGCCGSGLTYYGCLLFSANGKDLRRCGVGAMTELAIRVENISKRYRIGALQTRADTLRDVVVNNVRRMGRFRKTSRKRR
jgi:lipopolysaccharide transport system permease protein